MGKDVRVSVGKVIENYMEGGLHAKENANSNRGPSGLLLATGGEGLRRHNLTMLRDAGFSDIVDEHEDGGLHIHDLGLGVYTPYCAAHSLPILLAEGMDLNTISKPAKHLDSACNHIMNWCGAVSNAFSGAAAFNSVDTLLAPYAYKCYLDYKKEGCAPAVAFRLARRDIYQSIQNLIFNLNFSTRYGDQTPFSNFSIDVTVPEDMKDQYALVAGIPLDEHYDYTRDGVKVNNKTYGDLWEWQRLVSEAILDTLIDGDGEKSFTFPVLTINVTDDLFDHPLIDRICELTAKWGFPFFQNLINGVVGGQALQESAVRALCCRLQLDINDLSNKIGGLFGGADATGSLQVVTISLPYQAMKVAELPIEKRKEEFKKVIEELIDRIVKEHIWKREIVDQQFKNNFFPVRDKHLKYGFDSFFTTVGFVGLWECVNILIDDEASFSTDFGLDIAEWVENIMSDRVKKNSVEYNTLINLEATPAESAAHKLALKALKKHPSIPHRGTKKAPYFTNSHHLPVEYQNQLDLVLKTQTRLQTIPNGGTVQHFTTGEELTKEEILEFIKTICNTTIPYFSVNCIFSVCPICGYIGGYHEECPNKHNQEEIDELKKTKPHMVIE